MKLSKNQIILGSVIIFALLTYLLFFNKKSIKELIGLSKTPAPSYSDDLDDDLEEDTYVRRNDCIENCDRIADFMVMDCEKFGGDKKLKCLDKVKATKTLCRNTCGGGDVNDLAVTTLSTIGTTKESSYAVPSYYYSGFPVDMTRMFNESSYDENGKKKIDKKILFFCCNDAKYPYGPTHSGYCFDKLGKRNKAKICFKPVK